MIFRYADATSVEMVPGLLRRTLVEGKLMMICECTFASGVKVPDHSHPNEQAGYVVLGKIQITNERKTRAVTVSRDCIPWILANSGGKMKWSDLKRQQIILKRDSKELERQFWRRD